MDLLDESKENIQPLKRGRNISVLSTALLAQTDAEVYQQLMKEREEFEVLVRSYSGDDPLKPWYDYVQWVEQNFPKHGREGNLKVLLENCLGQFKDCEQYMQDVRFIDLWTRYMSFVDEPLEMYKQLHARGIGNQCAIFYQCWAEEYEQANDMKRADQVFIEGIRRNAQPLDELLAAHNNFQVRIARSVLGQNPMNSGEMAAERTALSTLRAHGRRRNMVDSRRVGPSVKQTTPGVLRPFSNSTLGERKNGNVQFSKMAVFNDENAPLTDAVANPQVKPSVSISQQNVNKENMLKPGRWNEGKFKKKNSTPAIVITNVPATPRNLGFQVHVDEDSDVPKTPKTDIVVSNVLKARKCVFEDEKSIPIAVFEPHDPSKVPMYPKSKVYSGGTEFSLEELRSIIYMEKEMERKKVSHQNKSKEEIKMEVCNTDLQITNEVFELNGDQKFPAEDIQSPLNVVMKDVQISDDEPVKSDQEVSRKSSFEIFVEPEDEMDAKLKLGNQATKQLIVDSFQKQSKLLPTVHQEISRKSSFEDFVSPKEEINTKLKQQKQLNTQLNVVEKQRRPVPTPAKIVDVQFSGCLKVPQLLKKHKESLSQSEEENDLLLEQKDTDQSLTVNTKAIINDVKGMWISSPHMETKFARATFFQKSTKPQETETIVTPTTPFTPFKIFSDVSGIDQEQENSINVYIDQGSREISQCVQTNCVKKTGSSSLQKERECSPNHQYSTHLNPVTSYEKIQMSTVLSKEVIDSHPPMKQNPPSNVNVTSSINFQLEFQEEEILTSNESNEMKYQQMLEPKSQEETDNPKNNLYVYVDLTDKTPDENNRVPHPAMEIPFVPSPGMTPAQLAALENTEDKENMFMGKQEPKPQHCKSKKSILQPSKDVYFVPLEEQQQQLEEEEMEVQQNPFSDETCCTEAFAVPLVSSTPMFRSQFKNMDKEGKSDDTEDNTIQLMNFCANKPNFPEQKLPTSYGSCPQKTPADFTNKGGNEIAELPYSTYATGVQSSQLSVILELSEQKRNSATNTPDGSDSSKSSGVDVIHKHSISRHPSPARFNIPLYAEMLGLQEGFDFLRNGIQSPKKSENFAFFSDEFRENCFAKVEFPSDRHRLHCEQVLKSLDKTIRKGSVLFVGKNQYSISSVSQVKDYEFCTAIDNFSNKRVEFEVKDNKHLWEQYIREEIRFRIQDSSMMNHFIANEKTYIFLNKHLVLYQNNKCPRKTLKEVLEENYMRMGGLMNEADILNHACQILSIVHYLHQLNIVHGSLSLQSFMFISGKPCFLLLSDFEKAVDMTLLSSDIVFDATERPLYSSMNATKLPPFQVDYIALANIFHCLIFGERITVHQDRGIWCITRILPENFEEKLWKKVFNELLNNSCVNLLLLLSQ